MEEIRQLPERLESSDFWSRPVGSLRIGQTEVYYVDAENPPEDQEEFYRANLKNWEPPPTLLHIMIKTYVQTDEEAGGCGKDRRALLSCLEGDTYLHNGKKGVYKNVGGCQNVPREYAVRTILIRSQSDVIDARGDWDYGVLMERFPHAQTL